MGREKRVGKGRGERRNKPVVTWFSERLFCCCYESRFKQCSWVCAIFFFSLFPVLSAGYKHTTVVYLFLEFEL